MKQKNKNKGITLISLVITIILLLILSGVTIAQLTGNGLLKNAKLAKEKYKNAKDDEDTQIAKYTNEVDAQINSNREIDIKNVELDYDNKVDISSYNSATNQYTVPSNGIIIVSGNLRKSAVMSYVYINEIQICFIGGTNGTQFYSGGAYSQFITKNSKLYIVLNGAVPNCQYFIPFK